MALVIVTKLHGSRLVGYYDLSVLSMSVIVSTTTKVWMGLRPIQFFWDFWNCF